VLAGLGVLLHLLLPSSRPGFFALVALRLLLGVPYGGLLTASVVYLVEFLADDVRGMVCSAINLGWPIGSLYSILVVWLCGNNWRLALAAPVLPCLLSLVLLLRLPESPRWHLVHGREEEAQRSLVKVFASMPVMGTAHVGQPPRISVPQAPAKDEGTLAQAARLLGPGVWRVTLVTCLLSAFTAGASHAAWVWGPSLLRRAGTSREEELGLAVFSAGEIFGMLGTGTAMASIDSLGRKPLLVLSHLMGSGVFLVLYCIPPPALAVAAWLLLGFVQGLVWSAETTYVSEAFPTSLRGLGNGCCSSFGRLAAGLLPVAVGWLLGRCSACALLVILVLFLSGAAAALLVPRETAGQAMPESCDGKAQ